MRRTFLRLLGLAIAATALITYINWAGRRDEARFNPAGSLQCAGDTRIAGAQATTAPTTRETRTPDQLAEAWANARNPELVAGKHRLFDSDDRVDIGFDRRAHTVAVLTFRTRGALGWHLDAVVACQGQTARSPAPAAT
ncbi:hypothetical protein Dvina_27795 [Dactylosporangium vinaceum]|uniref:Secreted protein n=1 Tax=Dactylosporangium vinaceum TaxID=53362 RepID=A0ABV5MCH5_9ACTN|nr:hypothetical protein [Dactylosporangium vinaceum]UAB92185.1 hypothetical protein Dvina_27795 [Dactylosporangium vinaceum]